MCVCVCFRHPMIAASLEVFNEIEWLHLFPGLLFILPTHWKSNWSGLIVQNKILFHSVQWRPGYLHQFCNVLWLGWLGIIFYLNQISFHINQSLTGVDKVSMSMAAGMMIMSLHAAGIISEYDHDEHKKCVFFLFLFFPFHFETR